MDDIDSFKREESDRNARAYGFEIGKGHPLVEKIFIISEDNPFTNRNWKEDAGLSFKPVVEAPSGLVDHARRELALISNDSDFDECIIDAVRAFASYGHSGGSASVAIPLLNDLLQFKNITPLTNNPDEWMEVSDTEPLWQSRRCSEAFSKDGGVTYYLLSEGGNSQNPGPTHISLPKTQPSPTKFHNPGESTHG